MSPLHTTFVRDDVLPSYWANRIQDTLAGHSPNLHLERVPGSDTTVRVNAGGDSAEAAIVIDGRWRFNTAPVTRAHPGGGAGTYDVFAVSDDNDITSSPLPFTDETDYGFQLRFAVHGSDPTPGPGVVINRKIGEIEWDGARITRVRETLGAGWTSDRIIEPTAKDPTDSAGVFVSAAGQTAPIARWTTSAGADVARVNADGAFLTKGGVWHLNAGGGIAGSFTTRAGVLGQEMLLRGPNAGDEPLFITRHDTTTRHGDRIVFSGMTKIQRDGYGMFDTATSLSVLAGLGSGDTSESVTSVLGVDDPSAYPGREQTAIFARNHMRPPRVFAVAATTFTATTVTAAAWTGDPSTLKKNMIVDVFDGGGAKIAVGLVQSVAGNTITVDAWKLNLAVTSTPPSGSLVYIDYNTGAFAGNFVVSRSDAAATGQLYGVEIDVWTNRVGNVDIGLLLEGNGGGTFASVGSKSHNFHYAYQATGYAEYGLYVFTPAGGAYGQPLGAISVQGGAGDIESKGLINLGGANQSLNTSHDVTSPAGTALGDKLRLYGTKAEGHPVGFGVEGGRLVAYAPAGNALAIRQGQLGPTVSASSGTDIITLGVDGDITSVGNHIYLGGGGDHLYADNTPNTVVRTGGQFFVQNQAGSVTYANFGATGSTFAKTVVVRDTVGGASLQEWRDAGAGVLAKVATTGAFTSTGLDSAGTVRATSLANTPATGTGVEMAFSGGLGYVLSFNRTGTAYTPLALYGSTVDISPSATSKISANSTGIGFFAAAPVAKAAATTDLRQALIDYGLYTTGGATPFDMNGGLLTAGRVDTLQTVRAQGSTAPAAGAGVELSYAAGTGGILSYNRTGATYQALAIIGSSVDLQPSLTSKLKVDGTGVGFFAAAPVAKASSTTDLRQALINYGLYTTGGATPLDLNGGAFTASTASITGTGKTALSFSDTSTTTGFTIGADTNLYRATADTLASDDRLALPTAGSTAGLSIGGDSNQNLLWRSSANNLTLGGIANAGRFVTFNTSNGSGGLTTIRQDNNSVVSPLILTNLGLSGANQGTGVSWSLQSASSANVTAGGIHVLTEQSWTATVGTQDSYMRFMVAADGAAVEAARFTSAGTLQLLGDSVATLYRSASSTVKTDAHFHVAQDFRHLGANLGFYNHATATQQTIAGSRAGNAALADLLTKLALTGLVVDGTSA